MTEVKDRMREKAFMRLVEGQEATRSRTFLAMGCGIKLIHQRRGLEDNETFESDGFEAIVDLSAVLFARTHSAHAWGDPEGGGVPEKVKEQLRGEIVDVFYS